MFETIKIYRIVTWRYPADIKATRATGAKRARRHWGQGSLGASMNRFATVFTRAAMAGLFFAVVTPIGVIMRCLGKDPLRLEFEPGRTSYWLPRRLKSEPTAMTTQY
jgi:hypothetical protein